MVPENESCSVELSRKDREIILKMKQSEEDR